MGQSKGGGYTQKPAVTPEVSDLLKQLISQASPNLQSASQGFQQFLPGGGGGQAISNAAQNRFQQETIPSIMNAFGTGAKSSSSLNQALAAGASNLNTNIAAQLAQMQLQAAQGQSGIGSQQAGIGAGTPQFAYLQRQMPFWQSALLAGISGGSQAAGSYLGAPKAGGVAL